ncbi:MAG: 4-phosphoerythronate dehydrogenase [Firmicutes bacterium]|nr:4-phosphoerythronate dehydrogenase [Bacillota bacterium]MCM1401439.1 4-phosphoerythronate dehydrogenase [Bacteroides sp.]MCM1476797.1 4-phosphoerythronate dehydrogenase [Bacteroides sp.]
MEHPHIIIESNIPFSRGLFDDVARVSYLSPAEITPEAMANADALITRTRTRCNEALLSGSKCKIIASATIGLDHVDTEWCRNAGIEVRNAPGCNAPAVAQYVLASIIQAHGTNLSGLTLGIIGVGHVGSIVQRWAAGLGMNVLACDPPRALAEGSEGFCSMDRIAREADVITVHTPYTKRSPFATHHLLNAEFFNSLQRKPMVINSARGPIADTAALKAAIHTGRVSQVVIDCWEGEPDIDLQLLQQAFIATPHIAGYSREGKIRATAMAVEAVAKALQLPKPHMSVPIPGQAPERVTAEAVLKSYNPLTDTRMLRSNPGDFEKLRNTYNLRAEVH